MKSIVKDIQTLLEGMPRSSGTGSAGTWGVDHEEPDLDGEFYTDDEKDAKAVKKQMKDRGDVDKSIAKLLKDKPKAAPNDDEEEDEEDEESAEDEGEGENAEEGYMNTNLVSKLEEMAQLLKGKGAKPATTNLKESLDKIKDSIDMIVEMQVAVAMDQTPPLDTSLYPVRPGLLGPYHFKNGKVLYYDVEKGKYYDTDSDRHLTPYEVSVVIS